MSGCFEQKPGASLGLIDPYLNQPCNRTERDLNQQDWKFEATPDDARLSLIGMGSKEGYACPLSQYMLADALGLSSIHVNRVLRQLREAGLVTFRNGFVAFQNYDQLVEFAEFDPVYLDQTGAQLPVQAAGNEARIHAPANRPSTWRAHSN